MCSGPREIARLVRRVAVREIKRQRDRARLLREIGGVQPQRTHSHIPKLCPRFAALARSSSRPVDYLLRVWFLAGRLAREADVLNDRQLRAFLLAYEEGVGAVDLQRRLGVRTRRAVTERLRRVSQRLEEAMVARVSDVLPIAQRDALRGVPGMQDESIGPHVDRALDRLVDDSDLP